MPSPPTNFRRRQWPSWVWGVVVTLLIAALQYAGLLDFAERYAYDKRVQFCQLFDRAASPSQVVVMLVDDPTLERLGTWPWPRPFLGEVIAEIHRAGARTIGLDVLIADPQTQKPEEDRVLADSIASCGNVVIPIQIDLAQVGKDSPMFHAVRDALASDPELWPEQIARTLRERPQWSGMNEGALLAHVKLEYEDALREVLLARIGAAIASGQTDEQVLREILPKAALEGGRSQLTHRAAALIWRARAAAAVRDKLPLLSNLPPLLKGDPTEQVSIEAVLTAARSIGFVDDKVAPGGKLRTVALLADMNGRVALQFGLAVACTQLAIDPRDPDQFRVSDDRIELHPVAGAAIVIPIRTERTSELRLLAGTLFEVPMRGRRSHPEMMFEQLEPRTGVPRHVISVSRIGDVLSRRESLRKNNEKIDGLIRFFLDISDKDSLTRFDALHLAPDDYSERNKWLMKLAGDSFLVERDADYRTLDRAELDAAGRAFGNNFSDLARIAAVNQALAEEIDSASRELRQLLAGRAVLFGFAAYGKTDQVPTALHDSLPGVFVHASIVNAILGGEMWQKAPLSIDLSTTFLLGLIATWIVSCRRQYRSHVGMLMLAIAYTLINGFILFDFGNYILALAYPVIAIAGVWGVVTARRALIEALDRATVERAFRTYNDPALVDYVLRNKINGRIRAQRREMSIVFVDLGGFTAGAEKLKSRAARVINFYMTLMVRVIRGNGGYVNKFLGDGIMFFFNAPRQNDQHAQSAVRTVLQIQSELARALAGRKRRRTGFKIRAGVSTGIVTVGDAGSSDASDYTVLGDIANLASRLESANKQFGTGCAISQRTVELCGGEFLMRPLGRFRVVGRDEPVDVFEPISILPDVTPQQQAISDASSEMVQLFQSGDFTACRAALDRLESLDRSTVLTALYRRECDRRLANPSLRGEGGVINLAEK